MRLVHDGWEARWTICSAHLSIAGALRELASPRGEPATFKLVSESKDVDPEHAAGTTEFILERAVRVSPEPPAPTTHIPVGQQPAELDEREAEPDDDGLEYVLRVIDLVENDDLIDRSNEPLVARLRYLRYLLDELDL